MDVKESGKLIAQFMGFNFNDKTGEHIQQMNKDGTPYRSDGTANVNTDVYIFWRPRKDWNDLIAVVEKVNSIRLGSDARLREALITTNIEEVYDAVVEFINWYNDNN